MANSALISRLKERKADLEAKTKRLNAMDPRNEPGLELSKRLTANGIAEIDAELKKLSTN